MFEVHIHIQLYDYKWHIIILFYARQLVARSQLTLKRSFFFFLKRHQTVKCVTSMLNLLHHKFLFEKHHPMDNVLPLLVLWQHTSWTRIAFIAEKWWAQKYKRWWLIRHERNGKIVIVEGILLFYLMYIFLQTAEILSVSW